MSGPHEDSLRTLEDWTGAGDDPGQEALRHAFLTLLRARADACLRECEPGHVTASALVLDHAGSHTLLTLHPRVGRWLQLGGHCEVSDESLAGVALREAGEESGIEGLSVDPDPVHLDVHPVTCSSAAPPGTSTCGSWYVPRRARSPGSARSRRTCAGGRSRSCRRRATWDRWWPPRSGSPPDVPSFAYNWELSTRMRWVPQGRWGFPVLPITGHHRHGAAPGNSTKRLCRGSRLRASRTAAVVSAVGDVLRNELSRATSAGLPPKSHPRTGGQSRPSRPLGAGWKRSGNKTPEESTNPLLERSCHGAWTLPEYAAGHVRRRLRVRNHRRRRGRTAEYPVALIAQRTEIVSSRGVS